MTATYTPLANVTLTASASSVTFSSIPATYRDLILVVSPISSTTSNLEALPRFNSDSGANYSWVFMRGNGTTASSSSSSADSKINGITPRANTESKSLSVLQIMDYAQTNKHKSVLVRNDFSTSTFTYANRWANTAAIHTISIGLASGSFGVGSSFDLYGIIA